MRSGLPGSDFSPRAVTVLRNCREAMTKKGRVLLVEMIVPDTNSACFSKLLDLNMLVVTRGGSGQDLSIVFLLDAADYRVDRIIPPMAPQSVIEAIPNSVDREESVHRVNPTQHLRSPADSIPDW